MITLLNKEETIDVFVIFLTCSHAFHYAIISYGYLNKRILRVLSYGGEHLAGVQLKDG